MAEENFGALMNAAFLQRSFRRAWTQSTKAIFRTSCTLLSEGPVELLARHEGHETTLDIIGPVTTFILAAVIRDEPYLKSARTLAAAQAMVPADRA